MLIFVRVLLSLMILETYIYAEGVLAGTTVSNQAQVSYIIGNQEQNTTTNIHSFLVDRIVDMDISWQDTTPVAVDSAETDRVLTMLLTNLGNGDELFALTYEHNTTSSFAPAVTNVRMYADIDRDGTLDVTADSITTEVNLSADANMTVFLVVDIPDANYTDADTSSDGISVDLHRTSTEGSGTDDVVDIVVRRSTDVAMGLYIIRDYWLESHKSATVYSDDNQTHTGNIVTYTIDLHIGGNSAGRVIENIIIQDQIPLGTKYEPESMSIDGVALTDIANDDAGEFDDDTVIVAVGVVSEDKNKTITFDVRVR